MTATTPPITAWYVLEVEGTGLASAQTAKRENREKEMLWTLLRGRGCCLSHRLLRAAGECLGGPNPARLSDISLILLQMTAVEVGARKGKAAGEARRGKQWPSVPAPVGSQPRKAPMAALGVLPG